MRLRETIADLREEAIDIVKSSLSEGESPKTLIEEIKMGLDIVGERFESGQYYLTELVVAGENCKECIQEIEPRLSQGDSDIQESVVLGTIEGDIHDLGKNIVKFMLKGAGFKVYDVGVDASSDKFVDKAMEVDARIIGLSTLLSTGIDSMKKCVKNVRQNKPGIKIMIGGGPVSGDMDKVEGYIGADAAGKDAIEAVKIAKKWSNKN